MADDKNKMLINWADNVLKRIFKEMETQEINPFNQDYYNEESRLKRSIDFKIHNASGGDIEKITFLYEYYALFVEYGIGRGESYDKSKLIDPFRSGTKYAKKQPGIRSPKPFFFSIINQRTFSLQKLAENVLSENITAIISNELSLPEKSKDRISRSRYKLWERYAIAKGRISKEKKKRY